MKKTILLVTLFVFYIFSYGQYNNGPKIFHITSSHTSFPDAARDTGHTYNKVLYDAKSHYSDSSVMIIVPPNLDATKTVDLIFWFHGWGNNIDSAAVRYKLIQQFTSSKLNAVLVLSETSKNAPDSYGGKLESQNTFKGLVDDIMQGMKNEKAISKNCKTGNIILAGHSGAYRVMAYILQNGNVPVQEVILFDALYSETNKFINWIQADKIHRFIDIFTDGGGTNVESREMVKKLVALNIATDTMEESDKNVNISLLAKPIVFIHSLHKHNDIINDPDNFQLYLETSPFLKKIIGNHN